MGRTIIGTGIHARLTHALALYRAILESDKPADYVIAGYIRDHRALERESRGFVVELVYATLRRRIYFDALARSTASPVTALFLAACELDFAARMTIASVLSEVDDVAAADLAALARFSDDNEDLAFIADEGERFAAVHSTPRWVVEELLETIPRESVAELLDGLNEPPPLSIRANTYKVTVEELADRLRAEGVRTEPGRLSPHALVAGRDKDLFSTRAFREGLFEIQDEGSQVVSQLLDPRPGHRVLDACAGAGGKTLHLGALMKGRGEVFAWDTDARRLSRIDRRIRRSDLQNVRVLRDADQFAAFRARSVSALDRVLVDAPCSGLGTVRRSPDIKLRVTPDLVELMTTKQRAILDDVSALVKPGGRMVYATCSILPCENSAIVEAFLSTHGDFAEVERRTLTPHEHGTDGFFAVALEKK